MPHSITEKLALFQGSEDVYLYCSCVGTDTAHDLDLVVTRGRVSTDLVSVEATCEACGKVRTLTDGV